MLRFIRLSSSNKQYLFRKFYHFSFLLFQTKRAISVAHFCDNCFGIQFYAFSKSFLNLAYCDFNCECHFCGSKGIFPSKDVVKVLHPGKVYFSTFLSNLCCSCSTVTDVPTFNTVMNFVC